LTFLAMLPDFVAIMKISANKKRWKEVASV